MTLHNILVVFGVYAVIKFIFWSDAFISHFIFADMDFEPLVPENARLWGHILRRSNLRYVKIVVEHFDERQGETFRNSCLGFLSEGLSRPLGKEIFGCDEKEREAVSYTVHGFPITVQIWAFEAVLEISDRFVRHLASRLDINKTTVEAYLHVYATLRPTEVECGQPYITTLVLFDDRPVPALDDLARDIVSPQFRAERVGTPEEGTSKDETSDESHEGSGTSGEEEELGANDSGEAKGEDSEDHDNGASDGDRV
ncbi:Hypothetical predicted protein [Olea europaea subsp. europaea]|uniref:Uncharacterized protein n=1 Tax=Olea europaea subsp. europaea TaxID=158383 RepID=A0A8S0U315_OLEEU|nr:Hypothetical predicted protein [Olea europaea subsp. europaea]